MMRVRFCEPVPHDLVHVLQLPKGANLQPRGHWCELHERVSALCEHAAPPKRGARLMRERLCKPRPHDLVHVLQPRKGPSLQPRGHWCVLQERVSSRYGQT